MEKETLYLVDVNGLFHRAYYAIKGFRTSKGMPTNALFGLASTLRRLIRQERPRLAAAVFDAGRETFRNQIYSQYKANRPPAPEDMVIQFPYARLVAQAMGLEVLEVPGFEADDVIATLTKRALAAGLDVVIVSSDKDLFQLVRPGVVVYDPWRDLRYDRDGVIEKMGVAPEYVKDLLALVGDTSDNVPGVRGIGEKGAQELVRKFGSLEEIYSHLEQVQERKRVALQRDKELAFLSRKLVTLCEEVPLEVDVRALRLKEVDPDAAIALWTELEFRTLLDEMMSERSAQDGVGQVEQRGVVVLSGDIGVVGKGLEGLEGALQVVKEKGKFALYVEFGGRDPVKPDIVGVALAVGPAEAVVGGREDLEKMREVAGLVRFASVPDYKRVWQAFAALGLEAELPAMEPLLGAYVVHPERESPSLASLALEHLREPLPPASDRSREALAKRACAAFVVAPLVEKQVKDLGLFGLLTEVEIPLSRVLAEMERAGVRVDREVLIALSRDLAKQIQELEAQIVRTAGRPGFNPNSPKQLADVLFGTFGIEPPKKTKTGPSTDSEVLELIADDPRALGLPRLILQYRSLTKLKSTYADALVTLIRPDTGRIHTSYNQTVAATGRLSSSDPNLQNIPIRTEEGLKIRSAFVSDDKYEFISADYSQIELRVLAHLSEDSALIEAFLEGADIHARTAARVFKVPEAEVTPQMRRFAKTINFGLLYGMGAFRLARDLGISQGEAQRFIDDYFAAFPRVREYLFGVVESARQLGYVQTITGRRRMIEGLNDRNHNVRAAAERMALNTPVQGSAADIIKIAMVRLRDRLKRGGYDARLVLQVHDELVLEVREGQVEEVAGVMKEIMEQAWVLRVPLVVEISRGKVWSQMQEMQL